MKKIVSLNLATILTFIVLSYVAYYLLVRDNFLHISISAIIGNSHHLDIKRHLLVLGLLPFYIAAMIFGTGILSIYLGSRIQERFIRLRDKPLANKDNGRRFAIIYVRLLL